MLAIESVGKIYRTWRGRVEALKDFSWRCGPGIYGLIGQNGAGKTTLLRICAGLLSPTSGVVRLDGEDLRTRPEYLKDRLGYLPQEFGVIPHWTVEEFLHYLLLTRDDRMSGRERAREVDRVLELVQAGEWRKQYMGALSGGMRRRIGIAQALFKNPDLLLLDEPTAGLDPEARMVFRSLLQELGLRATILLSTHLIEDVIRMCHDLVILHKGGTVARGSPEEVASSLRDRVFWVKNMTDRDLPTLRSQGIVSEVHDEGDGRVRARFIAPTAPKNFAAEPCPPTLEDAVLYYMHGFS